MTYLLSTLLAACGGGAPPAPPAESPPPAAPPATEPATKTAEAEPKRPAERLVAAASCTPAPATISFPLGVEQADLARLYPTRDGLPAPYDQPTRPSGAEPLPATLSESIVAFTTSSLAGDGFTDVSVSVSLDAPATLTITATGCNLSDYTTQLPAFLQAGLLGAAAWDSCTAPGGACAPYTTAHTCASGSGECYPWAFYLPLGQPLVNHYGVMLLNYPPSDALCSADYQNNFTMNRWRQVLAWGVEPPVWWANIVDQHPIAASGSGESGAISATSPYFDAYWKAMLAVVTTPPARTNRPGYSAALGLPVMVSGGPAQKAWGELLGQTVETGANGKTDKLKAGLTTAWVATNHPDVTTYQCCDGDKSEGCCDGTYDPSTGTCTGGYGWSDDLVEDEQSDFFNACMFENISTNPTMDFDAFTLTCARGLMWGERPLCIQGRLDLTYTQPGHCNCRAAAELFCQANGDDTCPASDPGMSCEPYNQQAGCASYTPSYIQCAAPGSSGG